MGALYVPNMLSDPLTVGLMSIRKQSNLYYRMEAEKQLVNRILKEYQ